MQFVVVAFAVENHGFSASYDIVSLQEVISQTLTDNKIFTEKYLHERKRPQCPQQSLEHGLTAFAFMKWLTVCLLYLNVFMQTTCTAGAFRSGMAGESIT